MLHRLDWEAVGKLPNKIPVWQAWALTVTWNYILSSAFLVLQFPPFHAAPPKLDDCAWHQPTTSLGSKTVPLTSSFSHLFQLPSFDDFPSLPVALLCRVGSWWWWWWCCCCCCQQKVCCMVRTGQDNNTGYSKPHSRHTTLLHNPIPHGPARHAAVVQIREMVVPVFAF